MTSNIAVFLNGFSGIPGGINLKLLSLIDLNQRLAAILANLENRDGDGDRVPDVDIIDSIPDVITQEGSTTGVVNLKTFDGLEYSLQVAGEYTLIESANDNFTVQVRTQHPDESPVTFNTAVATSLTAHKIGIYTQRERDLFVDGNPIELASGDSLELTNGSVTRNNNTYTITDNNNNQLTATIRNNRYRYLDIESVIAEDSDSSITGLLGNNNGIADDDLTLSDGTTLIPPVNFQQLYTGFANQWRINNAASLFDYLSGEDTDTFTESNFFERDNYLVGLATADIISGGAGNDVITGEEGADTLDGGDGIDRLIYRKSDAGVSVSLATNTTFGGHATGDRISNFEYLNGSLFDDTLTGNDSSNQLKGQAGNDLIFGGGGNDNIFGGRGADTLYGGDGIDRLSYGDSSAAVTIDLTTNTADGGYATGDVISGFEHITGSIFDDNLKGNDGINYLQGQLGNDILSGEGGDDNFFPGEGADTIDGGDGIDRLIYNDSNAAVAIDLANNTADGGYATGDVISNLEYLTGSSFDDTLIGNNEVNHLRGQEGSDLLSGGGGDDVLFPGEGADTLSGGDGRDAFTLNNLKDSLLSGFDRISDLEIGTDKINSVEAVDSSDVANLGEVAALDETSIQAVVSQSNFTANMAATFTFEDRTFLAINNGVSGYLASDDALLEITGFTGSLSNLAII